MWLAHPPQRQGRPVRQPGVCGGSERLWDKNQHDRERGPQGERHCRAHQLDDEERASEGYALPFRGRGQGGRREGRALLQQHAPTHERGHDDTGPGGALPRRNSQMVEKLP